MSDTRMKVGDPEYQQHAKEEIEHYTKIFLDGQSAAADKSGADPLFQPVPAVWVEVERRASELLRARTGNDAIGHVAAYLSGAPGRKMLSLGSGPGGIELALSRVVRSAHITCVDFNPNLVALGQEAAAQEQLAVDFATADLNTVDLPQAEYDIVFCHASLHHVLELERLAAEIRKTLRSGGRLIVIDVISRNGYLMWPETREVVSHIWRTLPPRLRINHTAYETPRVDEEVWEMDTSASSMECIRSQEILPVLNATFTQEHYVPYFALSRRFFDTMYGPNYRLEMPLDLAVVNWIWELDCYSLDAKTLRPETFFAVYCV
ncbi:MAG: class I SAM-dependent methyltransferase [Bryobacteraceae bacterium]|nr:class I SAM-dependent methyltransferase [Bryobacteraceae bacterium]